MKPPHEETWFHNFNGLSADDHTHFAFTYSPECLPGNHNWKRIELAAHAPELARMLLVVLEAERARALRSEPPAIDEDAVEALLRKAGVLP